jgi:hypothetical protein
MARWDGPLIIIFLKIYLLDNKTTYIIHITQISIHNEKVGVCGTKVPFGPTFFYHKSHFKLKV